MAMAVRPVEDDVEGIDLTSAAELQDDELLKIPRVRNLFNRFWEGKMKELSKAGNNAIVKSKVMLQQNVIKSPSDTTIYAPALNKVNLPTTNHLEANGRNNSNVNELENNGIDVLVSNFVDTVRLEQESRNLERQEHERYKSSELQQVQEGDLARNRMDRAVIEAKKFKATIAQPGKAASFEDDPLNGNALGLNEYVQNQQMQIAGPTVPNFSQNVGVSEQMIPNIGSGVSDDDFFHLTCHIEPDLIHKIKKGEFVELEKLVPKDKYSTKSEDNRLEWVQRDGGTFLVPAQRDNKIASFRRWEQAFRAYATIYCGANPHQSKKIWQYITVINTTTSSYIWEMCIIMTLHFDI